MSTANLTDLVFSGRITVEPRADGFMAYLDGDKARWEHGRTESEAIGKLVISHSEQVNRLRREAPRGRAGVLPDARVDRGRVGRCVDREGAEHVRVTAVGHRAILTLALDAPVVVAEATL